MCGRKRSCDRFIRERTLRSLTKIPFRDVRQENEHENGNYDKKEQADEQVLAPGTGNRWRKGSTGAQPAVREPGDLPDPKIAGIRYGIKAGPGYWIVDRPGHVSGSMS